VTDVADRDAARLVVDGVDDAVVTATGGVEPGQLQVEGLAESVRVLGERPGEQLDDRAGGADGSLARARRAGR
jgi:hypothetical protein